MTTGRVNHMFRTLSGEVGIREISPFFSTPSILQLPEEFPHAGDRKVALGDRRITWVVGSMSQHKIDDGYAHHEGNPGYQKNKIKASCS